MAGELHHSLQCLEEKIGQLLVRYQTDCRKKRVLQPGLGKKKQWSSRVAYCIQEIDKCIARLQRSAHGRTFNQN